jgi:hypothetical protein
MYFYTQKINRVEITPGSQAVCIVYIPSKRLSVKNSRQLGSIQYCIYMNILFTVGGVDLYMGIYTYMFIDHHDTSVV